MDAGRVRKMPVELLLLAFLALAVNVCAQSHPCEDADNAVYLPQNGKCLVPVKNAKDWVQAQKTCEQRRGDLYRLREDGQLTTDPRLARCLTAMPAADQLGNDFWIGAVSAWSRHWFWVNNTLLNPIRYVTTDPQAFRTSLSVFEVCSAYLSVDYCVSVCHDDAAAYTVIHWQQSYPCCYCSFRLEQDRVNASAVSYLSKDPLTYQVAESREGRSNMIRLTSSETFSETETLCAVVDTETAQARELLSKTCFSEFPFLCSLGNSSVDCDSLRCQGTQCKFRVRDECVQRDTRPLTWFRARAQCLAAGGDLWKVDKLDDMYQVARYLKTKAFYWVGATDHAWVYDAESNIFGTEDPDFEVVRCGHMFLERSGVAAQARQWKWSDTRCDQKKSYICQYEQTKFTSADTDEVVMCPWPIPETATPLISTQSTATPPVTFNGSVIPDDGPSALNAGSSYPIVPIIAACIAALVILLCAIFMLGYTRRRKWLMKKWKRTRDYMWPFWASTPTYLAPDYVSDPGFDSLSTGHTGMQSDSGSVFASGAFVFPDPAHPDGTAHKAHGHAHGQRAGSKDGSRRNESLDKSAKDARLHSRSSLNGGAARNGAGRVGGASSPGGQGGFGAGVLGGEGGGGEAHPLGSGGSISGDERLMSASYASLSPRAREYMTLSAHMNIHEDFESPNHSTRRKPEVALVTSDVDLNFTVNHAYARSQQGSRHESERSSERGVDEIDLPIASTVQIPTRTMEESVIRY